MLAREYIAELRRRSRDEQHAEMAYLGAEIVKLLDSRTVFEMDAAEQDAYQNLANCRWVCGQLLLEAAYQPSQRKEWFDMLAEVAFVPETER